MRAASGKMRVQVDVYTRVCLTAIAVLLTVLIVGLWAQKTPNAPQAMAGVPTVLDPNAQRGAMTRAQTLTNAKLDQLISLLKSGDAKVQVVEDKRANKNEPPKEKN